MKTKWDRVKVAGLALAGLCWLGSVFGGESSSTPAVSGVSTQSIYLEYREMDGVLTAWRIPAARQAASFKKEPRVNWGRANRGILKFGNSSDHFIPFVWGRAEGKLYLDLNRNDDFSDDPEGVFSCLPKSVSEYYQVFRNIRLTFNTPVGAHRMLVDLYFSVPGVQSGITAACRSCWEGKIVQPGQEWQFAFVDKPDGKFGSLEAGSIIVRPWADRDQPANVQSGSLEALPFYPDLFFGERAYHLTCAYVEQEGNAKYRLNLTERTEPLGELRIGGQYINRLLLGRLEAPRAGKAEQSAEEAFARRYGLSGTRASRYASPSLVVVLDKPGSVARVPAGSYGYRLTLKQGGTEARRLGDNSDTGFTRPARPLIVSATNAATLVSGGPLTNSVALTRDGRILTFAYRLLGANGETYQLQGERKQPEVALYRTGKDGDKRLTSGKFEYG